MSKCKDCICEKDCDFPERKNGNGCTGIITTKNFCDPAPTCSEQASADVRAEVEMLKDEYKVLSAFNSALQKDNAGLREQLKSGEYCSSFGMCNNAGEQYEQQLAAKDERIEALEGALKCSIENFQEDSVQCKGDYVRGMHCGVEDTGQCDVYDAADYGYQKAIERVSDEVIAGLEQALQSKGGEA